MSLFLSSIAIFRGRSCAARLAGRAGAAPTASSAAKIARLVWFTFAPTFRNLRRATVAAPARGGTKKHLKMLQ
jgi:hypothetical protein